MKVHVDGLRTNFNKHPKSIDTVVAIAMVQDLITIDSQRITQVRDLAIAWFQTGGRGFPWRRKSATHYCRVLSEVLLQRTKAETVARFIPGFIAAYPSWKALSNASIEDLEDKLRVIGLWRRRSQVLNRLATEISKRGGRFPANHAEIVKLPGVGHYLANAVLVFCHDIPAPLLDSSMARLLERCFGPRQLVDIRYDPYLNTLASRIVDTPRVKEVNWALLDIAAIFCKTKMPSCSECPIRIACLSASGNLTNNAKNHNVSNGS